MKNNKTIRTLTALLLLLLFIVGNTPKQWMHDVFANHVDCKNGIAKNADIPHINQQSFHCEVNHFVVESPYVATEHPVTFSRLFDHLPLTSSSCRFVAFDFQLQVDLRGPPSI